ncbi:MAG: hypothetical protein D6718_09495 [Acidobacteria bacterium]|nr:MAG: hypothetical protein D6718_09495 [Acidobacteriota bacterium]
MSRSGADGRERSGDWLARELAELPVPAAGEGFTDSVMRRLREQPRRRTGRRALAVALAAAAIAPAALWLAGRAAGERPPARAERLAEEERRLRRELEELRRALEAEAPVVYLGGDERLDLVVDLGRLAGRARAAVRPASARARRVEER